MADSRQTMVPDFHKQVVAVQRVEKLLRDITAALDAAGVSYALVGGNAVAAWVATVDEDAVRATKDVDILLRRADLAAATRALDDLGLERAEVLGATTFVERERPSPRKGVHVVFANEKVRPHYHHPAPDPAQAARTATGIRVIELPALVAMKLLSFRDIDRAHLRDLLAVELIGQDLIAALPEDLQSRLRRIQETPE